MARNNLQRIKINGRDVLGFDSPPPASPAAGRSAAAAAAGMGQMDGEDEREDQNVLFKYCLKSSPVLVRKRNHEQGSDGGECGACPAAKNEKEAAPPEEIFEALRGIPGLARDNLLRAYSTLIRDDRLFRSLMALPKNMRKDWLLMEIGNQ